MSVFWHLLCPGKLLLMLLRSLPRLHEFHWRGKARGDEELQLGAVSRKRVVFNPSTQASFHFISWCSWTGIFDVAQKASLLHRMPGTWDSTMQRVGSGQIWSPGSVCNSCQADGADSSRHSLSLVTGSWTTRRWRCSPCPWLRQMFARRKHLFSRSLFPWIIGFSHIPPGFSWLCSKVSLVSVDSWKLDGEPIRGCHMLGWTHVGERNCNILHLKRSKWSITEDK